ncbi:mirror-image polydactyly gene 1 protein isoform X2 [Scophthalmus maximus]|uniref:mirror-image polydactyly gene 1 protein isoform X2 n=1 Tax=Scophthalmus maximus TaxID=52904 RepID=UPI001FA8F76B|nr:mirror-image polydactyly gene 1 protein isoform X2 [Scophthalmus maximus]
MASSSFSSSRAVDVQFALQRVKRKINNLQQQLSNKETGSESLLTWTLSKELWDSLVDMYPDNPRVNVELRRRLPSPDLHLSDLHLSDRPGTNRSSENSEASEFLLSLPSAPQRSVSSLSSRPSRGAGGMEMDLSPSRGPSPRAQSSRDDKGGGSPVLRGQVGTCDRSFHLDVSTNRRPILDRDQNVSFLLKELDNLRHINHKLLEQLVQKEEELQRRQVEEELREELTEARGWERPSGMASSETPPPSIRQGARIVPPDSDSTVEEVLLAVGHDQLVFASRMNKAVVVFLKDELHVHMLVESGVFIRDIFVQVSPLSAPSTRITVSGVPPFIPNKLLESELRRLASGFRTLSLGCRDVRHVQSLRRQAFMFLDSPTQTLEVSFRVRHGDGHYVVYASSRSMKCFKFGDVGHKRFACPRGGASGPVPWRNLPRALVPRRVPPVGLWFLQLRTMRRRVKQTVTNSPSLLMKIQRDRVRTRTCRCLGLQATLSLQPRLIHNCRNNPPDTSREGQGLSTSQVSGEDMEYDSESDSISTVGATNSYYSLEEVNQFLDETFGRSVRVQEYFEDTDKFIKTVVVLKRKTGFDQLDEKKRFRLKKHITTLRKGQVRNPTHNLQNISLVSLNNWISWTHGGLNIHSPDSTHG